MGKNTICFRRQSSHFFNPGEVSLICPIRKIQTEKKMDTLSILCYQFHIKSLIPRNELTCAGIGVEHLGVTANSVVISVSIENCITAKGVNSVDTGNLGGHGNRAGKYMVLDSLLQASLGECGFRKKYAVITEFMLSFKFSLFIDK